MARQKKTASGNGATVGFEAQLWAAAKKMARLTKELDAQFAESAKLEKEIRKNRKGLGYGA